MKTLIVYASKNGASEECAKRIASQLHGEVFISNVEEAEKYALEDFTSVILGGSIYVGSIQKELRQYMEKYKQQLLTKKIGCYICCMTSANEAGFMEKYFPTEIYEHASAKNILGGRLDKTKLNFILRKFANSIEKKNGKPTSISQDAIDAFVLAMNNEGDAHGH